MSCDDIPDYEDVLTCHCLQTAERGSIINGLIWMGNFDEMYRRIEEKMKAGFRCIKVKIGAIDFERELELLAHIRQHFSPQEIELRVDANGAFSPADAPRKLEQLSRFHLHSIEQPIRAGQWEEMSKLCQETPIPIALDEELIGINHSERKRQLLDTIRPQYIILKPSLHGGLHGSEEWNKACQRKRHRFMGDFSPRIKRRAEQHRPMVCYTGPSNAARTGHRTTLHR